MWSDRYLQFWNLFRERKTRTHFFRERKKCIPKIIITISYKKIQQKRMMILCSLGTVLHFAIFTLPFVKNKKQYEIIQWFYQVQCKTKLHVRNFIFENSLERNDFRKKEKFLQGIDFKIIWFISVIALK